MAALPRNLPRLASLADFDRSNGLVIMTYGFADSGSIRHHEQVYTEWGLWLTILGGASLAVGAVLTLLRR
jgi:hypothetical protein